MGKSHKRALESRLEILLIHLLKLQFQPGRKTPGWERTVREQRRRLTDHLLENPSLKPNVPEAQAKAYSYAITGASGETGLAESTFPAHCPWTFEQIMDPDFWPEST